MKLKEIFVSICAILLILLFTYTAWDKVLNHEIFLNQMRMSPFPLMKIWAVALVWLVPIVEILIAVFLWLEHFRRRGLIASMVLLGVFEVYIGGMLVSGKELPCTCSGVFNMGWDMHLIFNLAFIGVAGVGLLAHDNRWPFRPRRRRLHYSRA